MTAEFTDTDEFRGARFTSADLAGATFRDCGFRGVRIVDSLLADVIRSGELGLGGILLDGTARAAALAGSTLRAVRAAMSVDYLSS